ncbi:MAG: hypothetical protein WC851_01140 [Candidatus Shapirobacteria bacterium]|jgi:hypothetical protein
MAKSQKILTIIFFLICVIIQVIPLIKSGLTYSFGIGYWGAMGHDGVWHQSLSSQIHNPLSLTLPMYHSVPLQGYHPFYNILVSTLHQLTLIPINFLIFQLLPVITAIIFCYLSFQIGIILTNKKLGGYTLLFLNTFANSFGWIVTIFRNGTLSGESMFWAMQSPSNQINPPYQLSLVLILLLIFILLKSPLLKELNVFSSLSIILILVLLPITKVYSAPIGFGIFAYFVLFNIIKFKNFRPLYLLIISLVLSSALFFNYNRTSLTLLEFHPFWFINSMIESPDRLYIPRLANMRYTLESSGRIGPRLLTLQTFTLVLFVIGNFGWRILGFIPHKKTNIYTWMLNSLILFTVLIPTFFIQKGTSWNTIQFMYYGLFLGNIGLTLFILSQKNIIQKILISIIILFSVIPLIGSIPQYLGTIPPSALPSNEIKALDYLSQKPQGIVLTVPYDNYQKFNFEFTPVPLYAYETTSYVSAYSKHPTFLEDEMNLGNSGIDFKPTLDASKKFFEQKNIFQDRGFLVNNQIDYIYITGLQVEKYPLNHSELSIKEIYNEGGTLIYQVLR